MALTDTSIRNAKAKDKAYKLADERGLFIFITPAGSKLWRFKYRFEGKEKLLSIGAYPDIGLAKARAKRDEARKLLTDAVDPSENRKAMKASKTAEITNSFETVAREWFNRNSPNWATNHAATIIRRLEKDIFPWLGNQSIAMIKASEILSCLRRQAVAILCELYPLTSSSHYVFPSFRSDKNPMSNNAILSALRRMGFGKEEMTGHGFRAMARTVLDEVLGVRPDFIEQQLAHAVRDTNGRAYNRTAHLVERKKMMQMWADYLDELKSEKYGLTS